VTFHELAPSLTRIEVNLDVDPGSLIEKAARGMRHVKRAVRADLHRYKAFIEMQELETGAWRGVIEDGELVEEHDESYDEERDYSDVEDLRDEAEGSEDEGDEEDEEPTPVEELPRDKTGRFQRGAGAKPTAKSAASSSRSSSRSSGSGRSQSSSSGNGNGKTESKSTPKRQSGGRSRGSSNGSGSSKSSSSSRRRTASSRS
jgi:hypothetical protein